MDRAKNFYMDFSKLSLGHFLDMGYKAKLCSKVLKCLDRCFQSWKSVSSKTAIDPSSRFGESETLFQHQNCIKH